MRDLQAPIGSSPLQGDFQGGAIDRFSNASMFLWSRHISQRRKAVSQGEWDEIDQGLSESFGSWNRKYEGGLGGSTTIKASQVLIKFYMAFEGLATPYKSKYSLKRP